MGYKTLRGSSGAYDSPVLLQEYPISSIYGYSSLVSSPADYSAFTNRHFWSRVAWCQGTCGPVCGLHLTIVFFLFLPFASLCLWPWHLLPIWPSFMQINLLCWRWDSCQYQARKEPSGPTVLHLGFRT